MITINFGKPEHGWLPVVLNAGNFHLKLDASDVPANPIELLCEALIQTLVGGSARVLWNLEPAVCWFDLDNQREETVFTITESHGYTQSGNRTLQLTGSKHDLLFPFYEGLKVFAAHEFSEEHWPRTDGRKIERIGRLLQEQG